MKYISILPVLLLLAACARDGAETENPANGDPVKGDPSSATDCPVISSHSWSAWIDAEPPEPARLHIRGEAVLPTPGYTASWRIGAADRMIPPGQHMHLSFAAPDAVVTQVITTENVAYEGEATYPEYRVIYVHCGDAQLAEISDITTAH